MNNARDVPRDRQQSKESNLLWKPPIEDTQPNHERCRQQEVEACKEMHGCGGGVFAAWIVDYGIWRKQFVAIVNDEWSSIQLLSSVPPADSSEEARAESDQSWEPAWQRLSPPGRRNAKCSRAEWRLGWQTLLEESSTPFELFHPNGDKKTIERAGRGRVGRSLLFLVGWYIRRSLVLDFCPKSFTRMTVEVSLSEALHWQPWNKYIFPNSLVTF